VLDLPHSRGWFVPGFTAVCVILSATEQIRTARPGERTYDERARGDSDKQAYGVLVSLAAIA